MFNERWVTLGSLKYMSPLTKARVEHFNVLAKQCVALRKHRPEMKPIHKPVYNTFCCLLTTTNLIFFFALLKIKIVRSLNFYRLETVKMNFICLQKVLCLIPISCFTLWCIPPNRACLYFRSCCGFWGQNTITACLSCQV